MALTAEEFEGQTVKALKTLVAKLIGVPRFRQRWLSEDHTELQEDSLVSASNVQLVVVDFVPADDEEVEKLFHACSCNLLEQVDELLRKPLNPNVADAKDSTALHFAAVSGDVECVALLLEAGANKDAANSRGETALHLTSICGHLEVVRLLVEAGCDKDASNSKGSTALSLAAWHGHKEVELLLLSADSV